MKIALVAMLLFASAGLAQTAPTPTAVATAPGYTESVSVDANGKVTSSSQLFDVGAGTVSMPPVATAQTSPTPTPAQKQTNVDSTPKGHPRLVRKAAAIRKPQPATTPQTGLAPCVRLAGMNFAFTVWLTNQGKMIQRDVNTSFIPQQERLDEMKKNLQNSDLKFAKALKTHDQIARDEAEDQSAELRTEIEHAETRLKEDYTRAMKEQSAELAAYVKVFAVEYAEKRGYKTLLDLSDKANNPVINLFGPADLTFEVAAAYNKAHPENTLTPYTGTGSK